MKTTGELLAQMGLDKAREIVAQNKTQYRVEVHSLIANHNMEGICFGRCFFPDEEIRAMLYSLYANETLDFEIRFQAIYEILTEPKTPDDVKETWLQFILANRDEFEAMCKKYYIEDRDGNINHYYGKLISNKIPETPPNKKWVYFIELVILFKTKESILKIINTQIDGSSDSFLRKAGENCLAIIKA